MDLFPFDEAFTMTLYDYGVSLWSIAVQFVSGFLTQNPANSEVLGGAYAYVISFLSNSTLQHFAYSVLTVCFLFNMIDRLTTEPERMHAETIIMMYMRLGIGSAMIYYLPLIISSLIDFGTALAALFMGNKRYTIYSHYGAMQGAVNDLNFIESIFMCLLAIVFFVAMLACAFNLFKAAISIYTEMLSLIPYAPVVTGTMTGGHHVSSIAITYLKSFIGKCLVASFVAIMISVCAYICPEIVGQIVDACKDVMEDSDLIKPITYMLEHFLSAALTTACIMGADQKIKYNLGL